MEKSEKISCATGLASILLPLGLKGVGVDLHPIVYWVGLAIGTACLIYASHGLWEVAFDFMVPGKSKPQVLPQDEGQYIKSLIQKIRADADAYRLFLQLTDGGPGRAPGIRSTWKRVSNKLLYVGENPQPTEEERLEKQAIFWFVSNGIAEATKTTDDGPTSQWYMLTDFGWKVKERYKELYPLT